MLDLVGVHKITDRTEQTAGLRRTNIRSHVIHEAHFEAEQLAIAAGRDGKFRHAGRSGRAGAERFQSVFDPLDRPTGFPRRQRHQGHIGIQGDLIAKRTADIRWRHHPQLAEGNPQRPGQNRQHAIRSVKVGPKTDLGRGRIPACDNPVRFEWKGLIARKNVALREHNIRRAEDRLHITIGELTINGDIGFQFLVQDGGRGLHGRLNINDGRQGLVLHLDCISGVFGNIAIGSHHNGDRLANVAHLVDGAGVIPPRPFGSHRKRTAPLLDFPAGQYGYDSRQRKCGARINAVDTRMRIRTSDHRGMGKIGKRSEIGNILGLKIKETPAFC